MMFSACYRDFFANNKECPHSGILSVGLLYEHGAERRYQRISLARFDLEWLAQGRVFYRQGFRHVSDPLSTCRTVRDPV